MVVKGVVERCVIFIHLLLWTQRIFLMMQQAAYTLRNKTVPLSEREQGEDSKRVHFQKGGGERQAPLHANDNVFNNVQWFSSLSSVLAFISTAQFYFYEIFIFSLKNIPSKVKLRQLELQFMHR